MRLENEEINVFEILNNIDETQQDIAIKHAHVLSNLKLEEFISVSDNKSLKMEGESDDVLHLSQEDGWSMSTEENDNGYTIVNNTQDDDIELLIKGIEIDIY